MQQGFVVVLLADEIVRLAGSVITLSVVPEGREGMLTAWGGAR